MRGWRALVRLSPHMLLTALVLVVSVGAASLVFIFMNALWFRPSTVFESTRVVVPYLRANAVRGSTPLPGTNTLRDLGVFAAVAGQATRGETNSDLASRFLLARVGKNLETLGVTDHYFSVLGQPVIGRDFQPEDMLLGSGVVAVISDRVWRSYFHGDPGVIGTSASAYPVPVQIIGIAPPGFQGALRGEQIDAWVPHTQLLALSSNAGSTAFNTGFVPMLNFCRLPGGMSLSAARASLLQAYATLGRGVGDLDLMPVDSLFGAADLPMVVTRNDDIIWMVLAIAGLLLMAGIATLVGLLLVHYEHRRREFAVRMALGARRTNLLQQLVIEVAPIALLGACGALLAAYWGVRALPRFAMPGGIDFGKLDLVLDWRVMAFGAVASVLMVVAAAAYPMWRATHLVDVMKLGVIAGTNTTYSMRFRRIVLGVHASLTVLILILSGLFVQSVLNGLTRGPGFDDLHTLFVKVTTQSYRGLAPTAVTELARRDAVIASELLDRVRRLPGVEVAALGGPPIGADLGLGLSSPTVVETDVGSYDVHTWPYSVGLQYFEALGTPLMLGRSGDEGEIVVTAALASVAWADESPVGRRMKWGTISGTVVGVVDVGFKSIRMGRPAVFFTFDRQRTLPAYLGSRPQLEFTVRSPNPEAVRASLQELVGEVFPSALASRIVSGRELVEIDLGRERLGAWFLSGVGLTAWFLGMASMFGLVSYVAEQRKREFGVMIALGADVGRVLFAAVRSGLEAAVVGGALGAVVAALLAKTLDSLLLGISGFDLPTYVGTFLAFATCASGAGLVAAWHLRGARPMDALKTQ